MNAPPIRYWDPRTGTLEVEQVYGDAALRWLYGTRFGRWLTDTVLVRRWFSRLTGAYQSSRWSRRRIASFIREFGVPMEEFEPTQYRSFNDFFARRFRDSAREFCCGDDLPAFAEGRYLGFDRVEPGRTFPVKAEHLSAAGLLGSVERAAPFANGPLLIARLCPVDYHRFHYPDTGTTRDAWRIRGRYHSVNPVALAARSDVFVSNERQVSVLTTERFGRLAYVEVGALNVGRIVATHPADRPFARGDEKGYFLFGGSTVILLGEAGAWQVDPALAARTAEGIETRVRLGERVARAQRREERS